MTYFKRGIAWVVFLACVYGAAHFVSTFQSPWSKAVRSPVLDHLPAMTDDCLKKGCDK